jgi:hypothetical protein
MCQNPVTTPHRGMMFSTVACMSVPMRARGLSSASRGNCVLCRRYKGELLRTLGPQKDQPDKKCKELWRRGEALPSANRLGSIRHHFRRRHNMDGSSKIMRQSSPCGRARPALGIRIGLALMASTALVSVGGFAVPAKAQQAATSYSVPAGPLGAAITRFGESSGLQILYPADLVRGKQTPGVSGALTPNAALMRLLAGSGLTLPLHRRQYRDAGACGQPCAPTRAGWRRCGRCRHARADHPDRQGRDDHRGQQQLDHGMDARGHRADPRPEADAAIDQRPDRHCQVVEGRPCESRSGQIKRPAHWSCLPRG